MKAIGRYLLTLGLALASAFSGEAQSVRDLRTVDPVGDSLMIQKMRRRMDYIRRERPTVALVLSGGGAKGAAHVGAIDFIEKIGIPVDMVLGTSMGGLVGSLYSLGYSPAQMDSLLRSLDWGVMLSDKIPTSYRTYQQKKYREKYLFSVPFYYSKNTIFKGGEYTGKRKKTGDALLDAVLEGGESSPGHLRLGANDEFAEKTLKDNLFGSLPAGYIDGQNVNNLFSSLTVGYQDDIDFSELPIPFFCIAGDMVSGKAKLWHHGKLTTALRSTMSIPGIFAPVRVDEMVLVDGGVRNNYPTDVAKAMGADIVIGIELSDAEMTYSDINNIADIVWKFIDILGMDSFTKNVQVPDVTIKPELSEYNMLSFDPESIDIIIQRGYTAAYKKADELFKIKDRVGRDELFLREKPAVDAGQNLVHIAEIRFEGLTESEERYLRDKISVKEGDVVLKESLEDAVATLFATQSFESVTYELLGKEQPYVLNIKCRKGPVHQIGLGGRFDSETTISAMLNLGFNVHRVEGSSWDIALKMGANPYLDVHYLYKIPKLPTLNMDAKTSYTDVRVLGNSTISNMSFSLLDAYQRLYLSDWSWKKMDLKAGIKNDFVRVSNFLYSEYFPGSFNVKQTRNDFVSAFLDARNTTYDDGYFPHKGYNIGFSYDYLIAGLIDKVKPMHAFHFDAAGVVHLFKGADFIPSFHTRLLLGDEVPVPYMNIVGGSMAARYIDQQVPFMGINYATPLRNKMLLYRADLRFELYKNNYLTATFNALADSNDFSMELLWGAPWTIGAGLEYAYDSIIGPMKVNVHWSNVTNKVGAYFSVGFDF